MSFQVFYHSYTQAIFSFSLIHWLGCWSANFVGPQTLFRTISSLHHIIAPFYLIYTYLWFFCTEYWFHLWESTPNSWEFPRRFTISSPRSHITSLILFRALISSLQNSSIKSMLSQWHRKRLVSLSRETSASNHFPKTMLHIQKVRLQFSYMLETH